MNRTHALSWIAVALAGGGLAAAQNATQRAVMLTHLDPVPGVPGATFSLSLGPPTLVDGAGRVAFVSGYSGTTSGTGIWSEGSGTLQLVALGGAPAPGAPGRTFMSFSGTRLLMSDTNRVAFTQQLTGSFTPFGVWSQNGGAPGDLQLVALTGEISPTSPPGLWNVDVAPPAIALTPLGRLIFRTGFAVGNANYLGLFDGSAAGVSMCARTEVNVNNSGFTNIGDPLGNDSRSNATLAPNRNTDGTRLGVWLGPCSGLNPVVVHGLQVPLSFGLPEFTTFINPSAFSINRANQVAFVCGLNGTGITGANDTMIGLSANNGSRLIAREGDQVSGLPAGCFYSDFTTGALAGPVISQSGHIAFITGIGGPGVTGDTGRIVVRCAPDGTRRVVARLGDRPPGFPVGATYLAFGTNTLALNDWGQLVFEANIANPGTGRGGLGIFATDLSGSVRLLWESGQSYTIRGLAMRLSNATGPLVSGGTDGRPRGWNNHAEYGFRANYALVSNPSIFGVGVFVFGLGYCPADYDDGSGSGIPDGGVTIDDLLYYLSVFADGDPRADLDDGSGTGTPDGGVTIDDLLYYLLRFEAGC